MMMMMMMMMMVIKIIEKCSIDVALTKYTCQK